MLDRLLRGGQITALLALALLSILLVSGSATTRTTFEIVDGEVSYLVTGHAGEVDRALEYAGVSLSGADRIAISQENDVVRVTVQRPVTHFERTTTRILPFAQLREEDPELPIGEERVVQKGVDGSVEHTVKIVTDPDGTVHRYDLGEHVARLPVDEIVSYGTKVDAVAASWLSISDDVLTHINVREDGGGVLTTLSGESLSYSRALDCVATAYTTERQSWKRTATGTTARVGAIAVDPKVIPYGTRMALSHTVWPPLRTAAAASRGTVSTSFSIPTTNVFSSAYGAAPSTSLRNRRSRSQSGWLLFLSDI